jgi:hypothetical protein
MELNLNDLPNDATHVSGLSGEDGGIVKLNTVSQADSVFSHGRLVWIFKTDVPLMLLQPCVQGTACLHNVDLAGLTGDFVYTLSPKSQVMYVCMYVYSRGGPQTAPAPRPSLIYCAFPYT